MATLVVKALTNAAGINALNTVDGTATSAGGDDFPNASGVLVSFLNGDVAPTTVTVATPGTADSNAIAELAVVIPIGGTVTLGPFPAFPYSDSGGLVSFTYSSETSLDVVAFLPKRS